MDDVVRDLHWFAVVAAKWRRSWTRREEKREKLGKRTERKMQVVLQSANGKKNQNCKSSYLWLERETSVSLDAPSVKSAKTSRAVCPVVEQKMAWQQQEGAWDGRVWQETREPGWFWNKVGLGQGGKPACLKPVSHPVWKQELTVWRVNRREVSGPIFCFVKLSVQILENPRRRFASLFCPVSPASAARGEDVAYRNCRRSWQKAHKSVLAREVHREQTAQDRSRLTSVWAVLGVTQVTEICAAVSGTAKKGRQRGDQGEVLWLVPLSALV